MNKVAVVDYGMSNLDSVVRAIEECGGEPSIANTLQDFESVDRIILPGVGAFPDAMHNIKELGLDKILYTQVFDKRLPLLAICLGMQLLATTSWEGGKTSGLGWIDGEIRRFKPTEIDTRIPHIGWNEVHFTQQASPLFDGIPSGKDFYFVHSYYFHCTNEANILAKTPYCGEFASVVNQDLIFGTQFHPEKSQQMGFSILKNFMLI